MFRYRLKVVTTDYVERKYMPQMFNEKTSSYVNMTKDYFTEEEAARRFIRKYKEFIKTSKVEYIYIT